MNKLLFNFKLWLKTLFDKKGLLSVKGIVCYVCGNEEFLPPLEVEEERNLLDAKENGDTFAVEKLVEHNLRLVAYIARKFDNANIEYEDLIAIGAIGLIKAVKTFKSDKNIRLATYASRCIENEILMQIRKTSKIKNDLSLDNPLCEDYDGNQLVLGDIIPSDDDMQEETIDKPSEKQVIDSIIEKLGKREREIMVLRYGLEGHDELTQREVAVKLGISQSYISRLEKRILSEMKDKLIKEFQV
ncbi:MAG: sigma-70 family RNA polymerase sigma factor [Clostridiales bacterium]|nr:sigma-70 family RNA polymerase sigma factor [Clostridiales bacterium]